MAVVRTHLVIRGRVQGVWYRGAMQAEARRLGLAGWCRNNADGTVEAEAEGEQAIVDELIVWAHRGPSGARVSGVDVGWVEPLNERAGFVVRG
jgi:acylphosphatase